MFQTKMSANLIGLSSICFLFLSCFRTAIAGYQAQALPELERRARNYQAKGDNYDSYINDEYLGPGWFSVGKYRMPDSSTLPSGSSCGTRNPVYIKGHHPNITDTNCTVYDVITCEWHDFDDCSNTRKIHVRQCGNDTQYYLARTSALAGYCMDPPELANVTDFDEAPTDVSLGDLTVDAKLEFEIVKNSELPFIRFNCLESPAVNRSDKEDLRYSTYWFVESTLFKVFERVTKVMPLNESELTDRGYKIGFTIRCGIRMSTSLTGYQTEMKSSKNFYAGVKIHPSVINIKKNDTAKVILESTIPYGCYAPVNDPVQDSAKCTILVNLHYPEETMNSCSVDDTDVGSLPMVHDIVNDLQAKCGVIISGFLPKHDGSQQMKNVSLSLTSPFFSNSDPTEYRLTLRTSGNHQHKIWKNALLPEMQLNIIVDERFESNICYSHVDPHMCTCDGRTYENNSFKGSFILYYHDSGIQVQMKTTPCNGNRAYCACAVAVRAGGDVFLINRCGGLRFIDMTSCKDGGVLIVRKNSEVDYQVQTNIGTLIKITLLTGAYANMMNIDIHMAPKDLDRIKGLCGTFDKNKNNDFHDRNGATVSVNEFLKAWTLKDTDVDLLQPTCSVNVSTWTADNQALYCTCRCHDTEYDCGAPEKEAICSPSQYVNCTVSNSKTSELCEYFNKRCSIPLRAKRDESFILKQDPEIEMRRLAARADLPDKVIAKREGKRAVDEYIITEEMARSECTNYLHTEVIEQKSELLGAFNLSQAIEECTWDVNTGQDRGWMETHKQAALSAIETSYKRDANYTISHTDELKEFKTKTCPYDCDGNGVCLENGTCSCSSEFFGPTCSNIKSEGPVIEDIEGGGFCDQSYGRDCSCSAVQLEALHEFFFCKRVMIQKTVSGESRVVGTELVPGWYRNMYNGECCFEDDRRKRSTDSETDVLHYQHEISISNDGQNYGPIATLYVFDSLCVEVVTDDGGNASFYLKENTCIIEGTCYEAQAVDFSNYCFRCMPAITQYNWTEGCIKDKDESQSSTFTVGLIIGIVVGVVSICVAVAVAVYFMKKLDRTVGPFQEFSGAVAMSRPSSSRPIFDRTQLD